MKTLALAALLVVAAVPVSGAAPPHAQSTVITHYVCPMHCSHQAFDRPGTCPVCGMKLVEEPSQVGKAVRRRVGILLFDGVEIIDFTGPYEVFGAADFDVYTVAEKASPVTTSMGLTVVPAYSFAHAPAPDILVVPGGNIRRALESDPTREWVTRQAAHAVHVLSVCNGAFILAHAGLLDGLQATTTASLFDRFEAQFPKVKVIRDQRFVDSGRIVTAGGLSSGLDGALHVLERERGPVFARLIALGIEYDWSSRQGFARGALADQQIPNLDVDDPGQWELTAYEGARDHWRLVVRPLEPSSDVQLMERFGNKLTAGKWTRTRSAAGQSEWTFTSREGAPWAATLRLVPGPFGVASSVELSVARS